MDEEKGTRESQSYVNILPPRTGVEPVIFELEVRRLIH